jgi:hypothetical protein
MTLRPPEVFRFSLHNQISLVSLEWDCCLRFIFDSISAIAQVVVERPKKQPSLGGFVVPRHCGNMSTLDGKSWEETLDYCAYSCEECVCF